MLRRQLLLIVLAVSSYGIRVWNPACAVSHSHLYIMRSETYEYFGDPRTFLLSISRDLEFRGKQDNY